jgi:glutathione synthase/RimK-type ligase-like ATP-grasp enzyme
MHWCEIMPGCVVNRCAPMGSNFSKPYQAQLVLKHGFAIPETVITNQPELVWEFRQRYGKVIYKSISSVRSIVQLLTDDDMERLDQIRWCPTQFQAFVDGTNVRVHVVGTSIFATAVRSHAVDYRYDRRNEDRPTSLHAINLSDDLAERCVNLTRALGLSFAGIDLKITPEGDVYCFEVNPSPAYSYYEAHTGQKIAAAVALFIAGAN